MPATTIDELNVKLTADVDDVRQELNNLKKDFKNWQKDTKNNVGKMGDLFKNLQNTIRRCAIGQMIYKDIIGNIDNAISRLDTLNNYAKTMGNLGVSSDDANASLTRLSEALVGLPTTMDDAALAVQRFTSANGNVKASTEMFIALNNAILAGGASAQAQASALEQLSQAYAKGKPDMMEWRTAMQAMPAQLKQIAISMGYVSADQLGEALRSGAVSMNQFMVELTKLNKEGVNGFSSFEEQAKNSTGGVQTAMTNVKTAITRGLADIMNAIGQSNIAAFFNGIASAINKVVPYVVAFTKVIMTAVAALAGLFGKTLNTQLSTTTSAISSVGASAESTADSIDDTTKSTKGLTKAMKSLAGFDEMNVLTDNSSGGGSGSDSVAAGLGDLSGIDLSAFDELTDKVSAADEIYQQMIGTLSTVKEVMMGIWNSAPVQAYVDAVKAKWQFLYNFITTMSVTIWDNLRLTWNNTKDDIVGGLENLVTFWTQYWSDIKAGIETWGTPIINGVAGLFTSIWQDVISPACEIISKIWNDLTEILVDLWNKHGKPLVDNIGEFITKTIALFQKIWDEIVYPIIQPALEMIENLWNDYLKDMIKEVGDFIGAAVNGALELYNKFILPIVNWLIDKLGPVVSSIAQSISKAVGSVLSSVSNVVTTIFGILKGIINFVTGVFTGDWKKAWQGISDIFSSVFNGIKNAFKIPINQIIDGINGFIRGINKIKIPSWVPVVGGKGFYIPEIPRLAKGGTIDRATLALVGEAGREAVLPLDRNTEWMDALIEKIPQNSNAQRIVIQIGDDVIVDKIISGINDKQYLTDEELILV